MTADMHALQRGTLTYRPPGGMQTGEQGVTLSATVTDLGSNPEVTALVSTPGQVRYPGNAPTGGEVAVKATCDGGLTCELVSSPELPLTEQGESGTWTWALYASQSGVAHIYLVESVRDGTTNSVLSQTNYPCVIPVVVRSASDRVATTAPGAAAPPAEQASHSNFLGFFGDAEQQVFIWVSIAGAVVVLIPDARNRLAATARKLFGKGAVQAEPPADDGSPARTDGPV